MKKSSLSPWLFRRLLRAENTRLKEEVAQFKDACLKASLRIGHCTERPNFQRLEDFSIYITKLEAVVAEREILLVKTEEDLAAARKECEELREAAKNACLNLERAIRATGADRTEWERGALGELRTVLAKREKR